MLQGVTIIYEIQVQALQLIMNTHRSEGYRYRGLWIESACHSLTTGTTLAETTAAKAVAGVGVFSADDLGLIFGHYREFIVDRLCCVFVV